MHNHACLCRNIGRVTRRVSLAWLRNNIQGAQHCFVSLQEFVQDIHKAVEMLRSLSWQDIHKERFSLTPPGLFGNLVRTADYQMMRHKTADERCRAWLAQAEDTAEECDKGNSSETPAPTSACDKYGIDLDVFKHKTGRKPQQWRLLSCFLIAQSSIVESSRTPLSSPQVYPRCCPPPCFKSIPSCMCADVLSNKTYCTGRRHAR